MLKNDSNETIRVITDYSTDNQPRHRRRTRSNLKTLKQLFLSDGGIVVVSEAHF